MVGPATHPDATLVPVADLPIQKVLHFRSPRLDEGATYLQLVALYEGYIVSQAAVRSLYTSTRPDPPSDGGSGPVHPAADLYPLVRSEADGSAAYDLRAALMQLEWVCLYTKARALRTTPAAAPVEQPRAAARPRRRGPPALHALDAMRVCADAYSQADCLSAPLDEPGWDTPLPPWPRAHLSAQPPTRCQHAASAPLHVEYAMADALRAYADADWPDPASTRGTRPDAGAPPAARLPPETYPRLDGERLVYSRALAQFLALVHVHPAEQLPRASCAVEYGPYVRVILYIDQMKQAAWAQRRASAPDTGRGTRNSARVFEPGYERLWIPFGPAELAAARRTHFSHP